MTEMAVPQERVPQEDMPVDNWEPKKKKEEIK